MKKIATSKIMSQPGQWLIFSQGKLVMEKPEQGLPVKAWQELSFLHHYESAVEELGYFNTEDLPLRTFVLDLGAEDAVPAGWTSASLRDVLMYAPNEQFSIISRAWQYVHFLRTHRFCGQCGSPTQRVGWEMAVQCYNCQHRSYPRVSPCIIVAIYHQNKILLAKGVRHNSSNMYSTLAGFVESGETLEQAVHREVKEEVGVRIKNLRYFSSQAWPFPHSIMVGFIAEYAGGDIILDEKEILDAKWFEFNSLPLTPPVFSIAGQLIQETIRQNTDK